MEEYKIYVSDGVVVGQASNVTTVGDKADITITTSTGDLTAEEVGVNKETYEQVAQLAEPMYYEDKLIERVEYESIQDNLSKMQGQQPN